MSFPQPCRGVNQTMMSISLDRELLALASARCRQLRLSRSAYLRLLIAQDLARAGGGAANRPSNDILTYPAAKSRAAQLNETLSHPRIP
jgi:hypothetical protein